MKIPENQIYPSLLAELAEEFKAYCLQQNHLGGQVLVSS